MADEHAQPYFIATIPAETYRRDPAAVPRTLGQLVESSLTTFDQRQVGDLVLVLIPRGTGREVSQKIGMALGDTNPLRMPGGPPRE